MDIIRQLDKFKSLPASVLTIGSYDGIHRGHHGILTSVVNHAHARNLPSVLVTFDPHPRHILDSSSDKMSLIMGIEQKLEIIDTLGVDIVHVINFTNTFAETTAVDFLNHTVIPNFNPEYIIIGYDHHFGYKREGSPEFLKHYCAEKKIGLDIIGRQHL